MEAPVLCQSQIPILKSKGLLPMAEQVLLLVFNNFLVKTQRHFGCVDLSEKAICV